jgi:hypothetical protein
MFQRSGYLISMASVILLGVVAWDGSDTGTMRLVTTIGVLTSIIGMAFRWISFEREEKPRVTTVPGPAIRARPETPVPSRAHHEPGQSAHLT